MNKVDLEALQELIKGMDLPDWRKSKLTPHNLRWLGRNMGIRNASHPKYQEARAVLARLLKEDMFDGQGMASQGSNG